MSGGRQVLDQVHHQAADTADAARSGATTSRPMYQRSPRLGRTAHGGHQPASQPGHEDRVAARWRRSISARVSVSGGSSSEPFSRASVRNAARCSVSSSPASVGRGLGDHQPFQPVGQEVGPVRPGPGQRLLPPPSVDLGVVAAEQDLRDVEAPPARRLGVDRPLQQALVRGCVRLRGQRLRDCRSPPAVAGPRPRSPPGPRPRRRSARSRRCSARRPASAWPRHSGHPGVDPLVAAAGRGSGAPRRPAPGPRPG